MANPTVRFLNALAESCWNLSFYIKKSHPLKCHMHGTCQTNIHRRKQQHKHHHLNPTLETQKVPSKIHPLSQFKKCFFKNTNINKKYMFLSLELPQYFLFAKKNNTPIFLRTNNTHTHTHIEQKKTQANKPSPILPPHKNHHFPRESFNVTSSTFN